MRRATGLTKNTNQRLCVRWPVPDRAIVSTRHRADLQGSAPCAVGAVAAKEPFSRVRVCDGLLFDKEREAQARPRVENEVGDLGTSTNID